MHYDDLVIIESWLAQFHGASLVIEYLIFGEGEEENIIAEGHTLHAFTDRNGKVVRAPKFFKKLFEREDISGASVP